MSPAHSFFGRFLDCVLGLAGLLLVVFWTGEAISLPTQPPTRSEAKPVSRSATKVLPESRHQFQRFCTRCHGADFTGDDLPDATPRIPDFTKRAFQASRSDAALLVTILDGKGAQMPPFRDKFSDEQARGLVALIREAGPAGSTPAAADLTEFGQRYDELRKQLDELQRQYRELSLPPKKP
jgi:mono/diheme cytochrome c family protein